MYHITRVPRSESCHSWYPGTRGQACNWELDAINEGRKCQHVTSCCRRASSGFQAIDTQVVVPGYPGTRALLQHARGAPGY